MYRLKLYDRVLLLKTKNLKLKTKKQRYKHEKDI